MEVIDVDALPEVENTVTDNGILLLFIKLGPKR